VTRRVLGMLADAGAITFGLFFMGSAGTVLVGAYLFIIFGNGFRYGRVYLHVSQFFCVVGFAFAAWNIEWWQSSLPGVVSGWMISLIILPVYVGTLAQHMYAARLKAEQALKDCLGRAARGS